MNNDSPVSVTSALENRMKQLVPGFLLFLPVLHHHKKYLHDDMSWPALFFLLFCILLASFITETIGEIIEHKSHWAYWKRHANQIGVQEHRISQKPIFTKIKNDLTDIFSSIKSKVMGQSYIKDQSNNEINISSEWFEYLKRNTNEVLIADKYIHSLVDRMKLRCALVLPCVLNAFYVIYKDYPTWKGLLLSMIFLVLALCMFRSSRSDEKELINIRRSLISNKTGDKLTNLGASTSEEGTIKGSECLK